MRFRAGGMIGPEHVGRRATVRSLLDDGRAADVVGIIEACDEETVTLRARSGEAVRIVRARIVAARLIRPRA